MSTREVCKEWRDIIEAYKALWRTFEFTQDREGRPVWCPSMLDLFYVKSGEFLKHLTIIKYPRDRNSRNKRLGEENLDHLLKIITQSTTSLSSLVLHISASRSCYVKVSRLAGEMSSLRKLMIWHPEKPSPRFRFSSWAGSDVDLMGTNSSLKVLLFDYHSLGTGSISCVDWDLGALRSLRSFAYNPRWSISAWPLLSDLLHQDVETADGWRRDILVPRIWVRRKERIRKRWSRDSRCQDGSN